MTESLTISVCMATYDGSRYLTEQLESVLAQLGACDQLIVIDDASNDDTFSQVERITSDAGCCVVRDRNESNRGHVATFERALHSASRDIVVLADQDDVWLPGYLDEVRRTFAMNSELGLLMVRPVFCDSDLVPLRSSNERYAPRHPRVSGWRGIMLFLANRAMPIGATMSVRASDLTYILPFPGKLYAHDHWLFAMVALRGRTRTSEVEAILYRRHDGAVSGKRSLPEMIRTRVLLLALLAQNHRLSRRSGSLRNEQTPHGHL